MLRIVVSVCISALIVRFWWHWFPMWLKGQPTANSFASFVGMTPVFCVVSWIMRCFFVDRSQPGFAENPGFYAESMSYLVTSVLFFIVGICSMLTDWRHQHQLPVSNWSEKLDDLINPPH